MTVIGVDIGGTTSELVRIGPGGRMEERTLIATRPGAALVPSTIEAVRALAAGSRLRRIGIGVPGQVDPATGTVSLAVNLGLGGEPLALGPAVGEALGVPATVENDVRAAAMGASRHLAPQAQVLAFLGIGTGVAAGVVIDGHLHRGRSGMAGEIGHVVVDPSGARCACGLRGCLETVISGSAIAARWPRDDGHAASGVLAAAAAGEPTALDIVDGIVGHLVQALQWLVLAYGADHVVLGGGVGSIGEPLLGPVRARLAGFASGSEMAGRLLGPDRVSCAPAELPLGALGAAVLAQERAIGHREHPGAAPAAPRDEPDRADVPTGT